MKKFENPPVYINCPLHPNCTCLEAQDINCICCNRQNRDDDYRLSYNSSDKSCQTDETETGENSVIMLPVRMTLIRADGKIWYETLPLVNTSCESCTAHFREITRKSST